jgi:hypothetical protein
LSIDVNHESEPKLPLAKGDDRRLTDSQPANADKSEKRIQKQSPFQTSSPVSSPFQKRAGEKALTAEEKINLALLAEAKLRNGASKAVVEVSLTGISSRPVYAQTSEVPPGKHNDSIQSPDRVRELTSQEMDVTALYQRRLLNPTVLALITPRPLAKEGQSEADANKEFQELVKKRAAAIKEETGQRDAKGEAWVKNPSYGPATQAAFRDYLNTLQTIEIPSHVLAVTSLGRKLPLDSPIPVPVENGQVINPNEYLARIAGGELTANLKIDIQKPPGDEEKHKVENAISWVIKAKREIDDANLQKRDDEISQTIKDLGLPSKWLYQPGKLTREEWRTNARFAIDLVSDVGRKLNLIDKLHLPFDGPPGANVKSGATNSTILFDKPENLDFDDPTTIMKLRALIKWELEIEPKLKLAMKEQNQVDKNPLLALGWHDTVLRQQRDSHAKEIPSLVALDKEGKLLGVVSDPANLRLDQDGKFVGLVDSTKPRPAGETFLPANLLEQRFTARTDAKTGEILVSENVQAQNVPWWSYLNAYHPNVGLPADLRDSISTAPNLSGRSLQKGEHVVVSGGNVIVLDEKSKFEARGKPFSEVVIDKDTSLSTKDNPITTARDIVFADGTRLPAGSKFAPGTLFDGNVFRSCDSQAPVIATTPDGKSLQVAAVGLSASLPQERRLKPDEIVCVNNGSGTEFMLAKDLENYARTEASLHYAGNILTGTMDVAMCATGLIEVGAAVKGARLIAAGADSAMGTTSNRLLWKGVNGVSDISLGASGVLTSAEIQSYESGSEALQVRNLIFMGKIATPLAFRFAAPRLAARFPSLFKNGSLAADEALKSVEEGAQSRAANLETPQPVRYPDGLIQSTTDGAKLSRRFEYSENVQGEKSVTRITVENSADPKSNLVLERRAEDEWTIRRPDGTETKLQAAIKVNDDGSYTVSHTTSERADWYQKAYYAAKPDEPLVREVTYNRDGSITTSWSARNNFAPAEGSTFRKDFRYGENWTLPDGKQIRIDGEQRIWREKGKDIWLSNDGIMAEHLTYKKIKTVKPEELKEPLTWSRVQNGKVHEITSNVGYKIDADGKILGKTTDKGYQVDGSEIYGYKMGDGKGGFYVVEPKVFRMTHEKVPGSPGEWAKKPITARRATKEDTVSGIETLWGDQVVKEGDYIVTGVDGETYPVPRETFRRLYGAPEPVRYPDGLIESTTDGESLRRRFEYSQDGSGNKFVSKIQIRNAADPKGNFDLERQAENLWTIRRADGTETKLQAEITVNSNDGSYSVSHVIDSRADGHYDWRKSEPKPVTQANPWFAGDGDPIGFEPLRQVTYQRDGSITTKGMPYEYAPPEGSTFHKETEFTEQWIGIDGAVVKTDAHHRPWKSIGENKWLSPNGIIVEERAYLSREGPLKCSLIEEPLTLDAGGGFAPRREDIKVELPDGSSRVLPKSNFFEEYEPVSSSEGLWRRRPSKIRPLLEEDRELEWVRRYDLRDDVNYYVRTEPSGIARIISEANLEKYYRPMEEVDVLQSSTPKIPAATKAPVIRADGTTVIEWEKGEIVLSADGGSMTVKNTVEGTSETYQARAAPDAGTRFYLANGAEVLISKSGLRFTRGADSLEFIGEDGSRLREAPRSDSHPVSGQSRQLPRPADFPPPPGGVKSDAVTYQQGWGYTLATDTNGRKILLGEKGQQWSWENGAWENKNQEPGKWTSGYKDPDGRVLQQGWHSVLITETDGSKIIIDRDSRAFYEKDGEWVSDGASTVRNGDIVRMQAKFKIDATGQHWTWSDGKSEWWDYRTQKIWYRTEDMEPGVWRTDYDKTEFRVGSQVNHSPEPAPSVATPMPEWQTPAAQSPAAQSPHAPRLKPLPSYSADADTTSSRTLAPGQFSPPNPASNGRAWQEGWKCTILIEPNGGKTLIDAHQNVWREANGKWTSDRGVFEIDSNGQRWHWNDGSSEWLDRSGELWRRDAQMRQGLWRSGSGAEYQEGTGIFTPRTIDDPLPPGLLKGLPGYTATAIVAGANLLSQSARATQSSTILSSEPLGPDQRVAMPKATQSGSAGLEGGSTRYKENLGEKVDVGKSAVIPVVESPGGPAEQAIADLTAGAMQLAMVPTIAQQLIQLGYDTKELAGLGLQSFGYQLNQMWAPHDPRAMNRARREFLNSQSNENTNLPGSIFRKSWHPEGLPELPSTAAAAYRESLTQSLPDTSVGRATRDKINQIFDKMESAISPQTKPEEKEAIKRELATNLAPTAFEFRRLAFFDPKVLTAEHAIDVIDPDRISKLADRHEQRWAKIFMEGKNQDVVAASALALLFISRQTGKTPTGALTSVRIEEHDRFEGYNRYGGPNKMPALNIEVPIDANLVANKLGDSFLRLSQDRRGITLGDFLVRNGLITPQTYGVALQSILHNPNSSAAEKMDALSSENGPRMAEAITGLMIQERQVAAQGPQQSAKAQTLAAASADFKETLSKLASTEPDAVVRTMSAALLYAVNRFGSDPGSGAKFLDQLTILRHNDLVLKQGDFVKDTLNLMAKELTASPPQAVSQRMDAAASYSLLAGLSSPSDAAEIRRQARGALAESTKYANLDQTANIVQTLQHLGINFAESGNVRAIEDLRSALAAKVNLPPNPTAASSRQLAQLMEQIPGVFRSAQNKSRGELIAAGSRIIENQSPETSEVRVGALRLMGAVGAREAIPLLEKIATNDKDSAARLTALHSLEQLKAPGLPTLVATRLGLSNVEAPAPSAMENEPTIVSYLRDLKFRFGEYDSVGQAEPNLSSSDQAQMLAHAQSELRIFQSSVEQMYPDLVSLDQNAWLQEKFPLLRRENFVQEVIKASITRKIDAKSESVVFSETEAKKVEAIKVDQFNSLVKLAQSDSDQAIPARKLLFSIATTGGGPLGQESRMQVGKQYGYGRGNAYLPIYFIEEERNWSKLAAAALATTAKAGFSNRDVTASLVSRALTSKLDVAVRDEFLGAWKTLYSGNSRDRAISEETYQYVRLQAQN